MPIYTKTGDTGETALFGGKRVLKCHELVDAYGSIDELNCWIGVLNAKCQMSNVKSLVTQIQNDLFVIGSTLAGWNGDLSILTDRVMVFEKTIDVWEKELPELTNFILPGGSETGALAHVCRGITRRVERQVVALVSSKKQEVGGRRENFDLVIKYLNRLSDLFFMIARIINKKQKKKETLWIGIQKSLKPKE